MRKLLYSLGGLLAGAVLFVGAVAHGQVTGNLWKVQSNYLSPVLNAWGLRIPGLATSTTGCLGVDGTGWISANGSPCGSGSSSFGYLFPSNATTTTLTFSGGLVTSASTTIDSDLRVTGNAYVGAALGVDASAGIDFENSLGTLNFGGLYAPNANAVAFFGNSGNDEIDFDLSQLTGTRNVGVPDVGGTLGVGVATTAGTLPYWGAKGGLYSAATTTASCTGTVSCSQFTIVGSSPITLTGSASGNVGQWFTGTTYGTATSTTVGFTNGLMSMASSTFAGNTGTATTTFTQGVSFKPNGNVSASESAGGAINANFTGTNEGMHLFSSNTSSGPLLDIDFTGATANSQPFRLESTATNVSAMNLQGAPDGLGLLKLGPGTLGLVGSNSSSMVSIDAFSNNYNGMALFMKCRNATSTPCFEQLDQNSNIMWKVDSNGNATTTGLQQINTLTAGQLVATDANKVLVSTTSIGNNQLANSTISGVALGGTLNSLSHDTTLTGTSYNGSAAVSNWGIDLTHGNTWTGLQQLNGGASSTGEISAVTSSSTNLVLSGTGYSGTQCLHVSVTGVVTGSGSDCGTGAGSAYPFALAGNATTTLTLFHGSPLSLAASSTVFDNASTTLLTVGSTEYIGAGGTIQGQGVLTVTSGGNGLNSFFLAANATGAGTAGGFATLQGGLGNTTGSGGGAQISGGTGGATGNGGSVTITGGSAGGGNANGGDITLTGGNAVGNGTNGKINFEQAPNDWNLTFDTGTLSNNRLITWSDLAGTPALGSYSSGFTNGNIPFGSSGLLATSSALSFSSAGALLTATNASTTNLWSGGNTWLATNGGFVGIGTSSPFSSLSIESSGATQLNVCNGTGNPCLRLGFSASGNQAGVFGTMANAGFFLQTNGVNRLALRNTGEIGIGTTTPVYPLVSFSSSAAQLALSAGAGLSQWTFRNAGGSLYFSTTTVAGTATSTTAALSIGPNGHLTIPAIAAASGNNCLQVDTTGKITNTGSACGSGGGTPGGSDGQIQFNNASAFGGAANLWYITSTGALGIGTSSPVAGLSISSTTPVIEDWLAPATSTNMSIGLASSTQQIIYYGTAAMTINVSGYNLYNGTKDVLQVCGPAAGTGGALILAAPSGSTIHASGSTTASYLLSNSTTASTCDKYYLSVAPGPYGSTTPWIEVEGMTPGFQ